ncbi:hypothetical protein I350_03069 [Cryptococcus amylolentus CBS 6273]|uniref:chitin synthase n=1 Tax=Cryptococcus amylolentus CBS 6273 TaxID=1296118 RepID=A0A1E3K8P4_9TREE|nr:hypothetical protein I350_03069 [Cryptococcus amylolentus CBS 6273]
MAAPASRFQGVTDLASPLAVTEDTTVVTLQERYLAHKTYTALSSSALVFTNPYNYLPSDGDDSLLRYVQEYYRVAKEDDTGRNEEGAWRKGGLDPHVFQLALNAFFNMKRTGQDQVIITNGPMGSGKSELKRLAIEAISEVSVATPGKKGSKLGLQVASAEFIQKCFGNAHTLSNDDASRYGSYTELQFNERGRLDGLKTIQYYFERSRVSQAPVNGERNFHVFYYLIAGAPAEERAFFKLGDMIDYRYLNCRVRRIGVEDKHRYSQLRQAFKAVGMSSRLVAQVFQLLATVLHIGNLQFTPGDGEQEGAQVINAETLDVVAEFLGVSSEALAEVFSIKTVIIRKEVCTTFLGPEEAEQVRDELARTLYSLLFSWLIEHINSKLCKDSFGSFIALLDLPGIQRGSSVISTNSLDQLCLNFASEKLHNWVLHRVHETAKQEAEAERLIFNKVPYFDNSDCLEMLSASRGGLVATLDDLSLKKKTEQNLLDNLTKKYHSHPSLSISSSHGYRSASSFTINHYDGPVTYATSNLLERNANETSTDIVQLLRGSTSTQSPEMESRGSSNPFIKGLFTMKGLSMQTHPKSDSTIVAVQQSVRPVRAPSTRRKQRRSLVPVNEEDEDGEDFGVGGGNDESYSSKDLTCIAGQHFHAVEALLQSFDQTQMWYIFCLRPNDSQLPSQFDLRAVKSQIRSFGLVELAQRLQGNGWEVRMSLEEACERYKDELARRGIMEGPAWVERLRDFKRLLKASDAEIGIGQQRVFLSHSVFRHLEDKLRARDNEEHLHQYDDAAFEGQKRIQTDPFSPHRHHNSAESRQLYDTSFPDESSAALPLVAHAQPDPKESTLDLDDMSPTSVPYGTHHGDASTTDVDGYASSKSAYASSLHKSEKDPLDEDNTPGHTQETYKESIVRRRWVWLCAALTWWVPGFMLSKFGGMKRSDIRQAWREKLAINMIIWFICGCTVFVIAVLGPLICPTQHVYSTSELASQSYTSEPDETYTAIRGEVFDLSSFAPTHLTAVSVVPKKSFMTYGGLDATDLFPVQVSALCDGVSGSISDYVTMDTSNTTDDYAQYHDFRAGTNDSRPDWYAEMMIMMRHRYRKGFMGYTKKAIKTQASEGSAVGIVDDIVYDLSDYISANGGGLKLPDGYTATSQDQSDRQFMSSEVVDLFKYNSGRDVTKLLNNLASTLGQDVVDRQKVCLRNLFIIGKVDTRDSAACQFSTYILLVLSIIMVTIIGFKFLAALHFGSARAPEAHDKFIICQVPCYTEGEDSLRRTIDSLCRLRYDDKRKLIMVICDGNIKGYGNDKPTPAIVLDILGVDPNAEAEPLSFQSLGEGAKQHNQGKVYAGLYEHAGHVVPYLVVVKVGKPNERQRPGNRGKRDSQMVVMHFLNKVHFNSPMNPLELEMYHQIKNVIGVSPSFYEYIFMVDADTTVEELSLNRMVSAMMHDKKIIGLCGETSITNAKQSIVTMAQVYEYFISHHLAKAFESLFGSITCLPGCFSMYRLRSPDTNKPLFISNAVIEDYSENRVDTLHMKNLLHLGEDRYLTTLVLKHFVNYKTKFVRDAHAQTVAPDSAKVLLSQRRRWINSTVHNLAELVFLDELCGFCCFSMRFVVLIDLVSTIIGPVTVAYIGYLIYLIVHDGDSIPTLSIIMLAAIYGLQALIFIFRMRWDMIAWMLFYILAIPVFSFFLPLYSFWKMDDFSWGSTRLVVGDGGKKIVIHDEGKFDPSSIPLKSWEEYENELWDHESAQSEEFLAPVKSEYDYRPRSTFSYGYDQPQGMQSRSFTPVSSVYGMNHPSANANPFGAADYRSSQMNLAHRPLLMRDESFDRMSQFDGGSLYGGQQAHNPFAGGFAGQRNLSYTSLDQAAYQSPYQAPPSQRGYNPSLHTAEASTMEDSFAAPVDYLGAMAITDSQLEASIRKICKDADLDNLTKKGVRKALEKEYGCGLDERKETINRLVEKVLTGTF